MSDINWEKAHNFKPSEFSEDPDRYADPKLIYALSDLRDILGTRMFPSSVNGALARQYGSKKSQHYAVDRKTTGSDQFIEGIPFEIYSKILYSNLFTGIGIYLSTKGIDGLPWVMFHLDIRKRDYPLIWIVEKVKLNKDSKFKDIYRYPGSDGYWKLFSDYRLFENKLKGVHK